MRVPAREPDSLQNGEVLLIDFQDLIEVRMRLKDSKAPANVQITVSVEILHAFEPCFRR